MKPPRAVSYAETGNCPHEYDDDCDDECNLCGEKRNAYAAARALDANLYSSFSDGTHRVSFDKVVRVMKQTGKDLPSLYKETSEGGLAVL